MTGMWDSICGIAQIVWNIRQEIIAFIFSSPILFLPWLLNKLGKMLLKRR